MSDYTEYYKQAWERSLMKNHTTHHDGCNCVMDKIQKLEAENARLREALEEIGNSNPAVHDALVAMHYKWVAQRALKGGK